MVSKSCFDPRVALDYARALARPRRVGSGEDERVIDEAAARLAQFGYQVERQPFVFSTGANTAITAQILLALLLILLAFQAWSAPAWVAALPALGLLALLAGAGRLTRAVAFNSVRPPAEAAPTPWQRLCLRLGRQYRSANVLGTLPAQAGGAPELYLVAHTDSKSQTLPLVARIALIALGGLGGTAFAVLTLLRVAVPGLTPAAVAAGVLALLAGGPVLLLFMAGAGNASPGAVDNASGLGLVLHVAECAAAAPPPLRLAVLLTGAEELGLMGAYAYVLEAERRGRSTGAAVLNFDGVGITGTLALAARPDSPLAQRVRQAAAKLEVRLRPLPVVGALFDHLPFAARGYDAISLAVMGAAARVVHTRADRPERLDEAGFHQAGQVALDVLAQLSVERQPQPEKMTSGVGMG